MAATVAATACRICILGSVICLGVHDAVMRAKTDRLAISKNVLCFIDEIILVLLPSLIAIL